ncbi:hypothetical protein T310_9314, partial [Rasamsonia emersonii CBS 393.64]
NLLIRYLVSPSYGARSCSACLPSRSIAARMSSLRGVMRHLKGDGRMLSPLVKSKMSTGISLPFSSSAFSILNPHSNRATVMKVPCSASPCPLHTRRPQPNVMYPLSPGNGRLYGLPLMNRSGMNRSGSGNSRSWWWIAQTLPCTQVFLGINQPCTIVSTSATYTARWVCLPCNNHLVLEHEAARQ